MVQEIDINKLNREEVENLLRKEYVQLEKYDNQIRILKKSRRLLRKDMRKLFSRLSFIDKQEGLKDG